MSSQPEGRWIPTTDTFGARLALVRHRMGWNAKEAALACGISQGSWREWELKGRLPRGFAETAAAIAERTGVDDYWLMTGRKNPRPDGGPDGGSTQSDGATGSAPDASRWS